MDDRAPTWEKYRVLSAYIATMKLRDRRKVFQILRHSDADVDTLVPEFGFTIGEFCTFHVLARRR
jgi:hypothetical protein